MCLTGTGPAGADMSLNKGKGNPECQSCWLTHHTASVGDGYHRLSFDQD